MEFIKFFVYQIVHEAHQHKNISEAERINPLVLDIEFAKPSNIEGKSSSEDLSSNLNPEFLKEKEGEADIVINKKLIGRTFKNSFLKLIIFSRNMYDEESNKISFNISEKEGN